MSLLKKAISNFLEKLKDKIQQNVYQKSFVSMSLMALLLIGLLPLSVDYFYKIQSASQQTKYYQAEELIQESLEQNNLDEKEKTLNEARMLTPHNPHLDLEFAVIAIQRHNWKQADKLIKSFAAKTAYSAAAKGYLFFEQGKYLYSEEFLMKAFKMGFREQWLLERLGIVLTKKANFLKTFEVAGWPSDCQANSLAHAGCMKLVASWHAGAIKLAGKDNKAILFHQKRQIVFLGESLRSLLTAIEEVDGTFRKELIKRYEKDKLSLLQAHALYLLNLHLASEKLSRRELTKGEKHFIPV